MLKSKTTWKRKFKCADFGGPILDFALLGVQKEGSGFRVIIVSIIRNPKT